ncbi:DUF397 domain-containing protein [Streptomyces sp. NPDC005876]|jgi:hypothetical protein|uniref:DUF397 domain-containing protein n=1 Tax=Streptomyces sp. NPDC005876 TaxID=3157076 RepID=UPI0033E2739B
MSDQPKWIKSSHSDSEGAACVEVALAPAIRVRDSKNPADGPQVHVTPAAWSAFIAAVRPGD